MEEKPGGGGLRVRDERMGGIVIVVEWWRSRVACLWVIDD